MRYELFSVSGDHITTFESAWRFQEGEQIFVHDDQTKRNFIIIRLTRDVFQQNKHVIRLYCQEKKVYA
ncbi:hypothetical protein [Bacillus cereus]|uniref:hypothetical protein n=1 Tax=Bacillus cereus TaxID=1396 RepID=UPI001E3A1CA9|nr:hypothetical protein [Bacillus cereus]MCD1201278.1 hypothetical protein [Bacillus cereus]HDR4549188.1 hypothetical protein [Bacillus cereus]